MVKERIEELKKIVEEAGAHWLGYCEHFDCVRFVKRLSGKQLNLRSTGLWRYEKVYYMLIEEVSEQNVKDAFADKVDSLICKTMKRCF